MLNFKWAPGERSASPLIEHGSDQGDPPEKLEGPFDVVAPDLPLFHHQERAVVVRGEGQDVRGADSGAASP